MIMVDQLRYDEHNSITTTARRCLPIVLEGNDKDMLMI